MRPVQRPLAPGDTGFPVRALQVRPQPKQLWVRGDPGVFEQRAVAIVGSRAPTAYGMRIAWLAAQAFVRAGFAVVSGMARGIDGQAHRAAIAAGGRTIAVLGTGLDVRYPPQNADLIAAIPGHGAMMTEFAPGTRASKWTFPARNRLIAALAEATLIVEGRRHSGTANTADWTEKLNRTIWAVPGRLDDELSAGPNLLIQQGANIYLEPNDLLEPLGVHLADEPRAAPPPEPRRSELTSAEATLFDLMTPEAVHVDDIATRAALEPGLLLAALSTLELQGLIVQLPGKRFALAS